MDVDGTEEDMETEDEEDMDEEVDQLDSDTEDEAAAPPVASAPKARQRRTVQRVAGQPAIPLDRVETILDADGKSPSPSVVCLLCIYDLAGMSQGWVVICLERHCSRSLLQLYVPSLTTPQK